LWNFWSFWWSTKKKNKEWTAFVCIWHMVMSFSRPLESRIFSSPRINHIHERRRKVVKNSIIDQRTTYWFFFKCYINLLCSCCCHLLFCMLGSISWTAAGVYVCYELYGWSFDTQHFHLHHLCFRHLILRFYMHKSNFVQSHEQQIPSSF
jgi:hypothetical protein